jgi:small subunit ribosomal protein S8
MSHDTIGDFLTAIRNGVMVSKLYIVTPYSSFRHSIAALLKEEGFIKDVVTVEEDSKKALKIFLKYVDGESVIHELKRVSTPGGRAYKRSGNLKPVIGGLGITVLTTSQGVMTDKRARQLSVGGEVLCTVW